MSNSIKRDGDISRLHPAIRDKVKAIRDQLHKENIPFEVFEAFRTPERQAHLFAKGRTTKGPKVTWVNAWFSIHQYGLAVDFVLFKDGKWSWDDQGAEAKWWDRMHELAKDHGMTPIYNSKGQLIEKPHIQLEGASGRTLYKGAYPAGGDAAWAEQLALLIDNWDGATDPPPKPSGAPQHPGIDPALLEDLEETATAGADVDSSVELRVSNALSAAEGDARFQKLHAFVKKWEGGFVNNPHDNGGATNMGITQGTLANWRGRDVSVEDVRTLSRREADAILRANYYALCRCGEMSERTAMVVYNGAVLHGPRRSIKFLQTAFNNLGMTADSAPLEVDGILGPKTMGGARQTDAGILSEAYMDVQDAYFRTHEDFEHFGVGWLNRMASLREFVATLPQGAGLRPKTVMKVADRKLDLDIDDVLRIALAGATGGKSAALAAVLGGVLKRDDEESVARARGKVLLKELLADRLDLEIAEPEPVDLKVEAVKALTPVNAALGEGLGRALDGKKSVIGIVGLIAAAIVPELGLVAPGAPQLTELLDGDNQTIIFTLLSLFTGWGFLGKIDKAIREVRGR